MQVILTVCTDIHPLHALNHYSHALTHSDILEDSTLYCVCAPAKAEERRGLESWYIRSAESTQSSVCAPSSLTIRLRVFTGE